MDAVIVHGACSNSLEAVFVEACKAAGIEDEPHPADWNGPLGKAAGKARNVYVQTCDRVEAFQMPWGTGTQHAIGLANAKGVEVVEHVVEPLKIWTSRVKTRPDALNITRAMADIYQRSGECHPGAAFAPSWDILRPAIAGRKLIEAGLGNADTEMNLWATYWPAFRDEMRESYVVNRNAWDWVLIGAEGEPPRESVCLQCVCNLERYPGHCHRLLVAEYMAKAGAEYMWGFNERSAGRGPGGRFGSYAERTHSCVQVHQRRSGAWNESDRQYAVSIAA
jgi:hypothetical protein